MSKRRLRINNATLRDLPGKSGAAIARRVRLDIADLNPRSPFKNRIGQVVARRQDQVARTMAAYYKGMVREVANTLRDPPMRAFVRLSEDGDSFGFPVADRVMVRKPVTLSLDSGVSRNPTSDTFLIESGRQTAEPWQGLSPAYAASLENTRWQGLPRSIHFWRKTSKLNSRIAAWYATGFSRVNNPNNYKVGRIEEKKRFGKTAPYSPGKTLSGYTALPREGVFVSSNTKQILSTYTFAVQHPRLGNVALDQILRKSYVTGKAQEYTNTRAKKVSLRYTKGPMRGRTITQMRQVSRLPEDPQNLYRLLLPEQSRPMLARFAASVGRREMEVIRKMLKRK